MNQELKQKGYSMIGIGLLLEIAASIALSLTNLSLLILGTVSFIGFVVFALGCYYYAKSKGRSGLWAILGIFSLIGFIILLVLPDKSEVKSQPVATN